MLLSQSAGLCGGTHKVYVELLNSVLSPYHILKIRDSFNFTIPKVPTFKTKETELQLYFYSKASHLLKCLFRIG